MSVSAYSSEFDKSASTFGFLHLSGLHQGLDGQSHLWPSLREKFYGDLKQNHEVNGPWHALLFTGDLTQSG